MIASVRAHDAARMIASVRRYDDDRLREDTAHLRAWARAHPEHHVERYSLTCARCGMKGHGANTCGGNFDGRVSVRKTRVGW